MGVGGVGSCLSYDNECRGINESMLGIMVVVAFIVILFVSVLVASELAKKSVTAPEKAQYNYKTKQYLMTYAENNFYKFLVEAVSDTYYIYPQVHLSKIVDHKVEGQNWKRAFSHVNQKSVDYILCDKHYISPKLVIELDDKTHERPDRIDRDREVERILRQVGLPLLRIKKIDEFTPSELADKIKSLVA